MTQRNRELSTFVEEIEQLYRMMDDSLNKVQDLLGDNEDDTNRIVELLGSLKTINDSLLSVYTDMDQMKVDVRASFDTVYGRMEADEIQRSTDMNSIQSDMKGMSENVSVLDKDIQNKIYQESIERKNADSELSGSIDSLSKRTDDNRQLYQELNNSISTQITALRASVDSSIQSITNDVNGSKNVLNTFDIALTEFKSQVNGILANISSILKRIETDESNLSTETSNRIDADAQINTRIDKELVTVNSSISGLDNRITSTSSGLSNTISELSQRLETINTNLTNAIGTLTSQTMIWSKTGKNVREEIIAGTVVSDSSGNWTFNYSNVGFKTVTGVFVNAISSGSRSIDTHIATIYTPTLGSVSGKTKKGVTLVLGGTTYEDVGSVTVYIRVYGTK